MLGGENADTIRKRAIRQRILDMFEDRLQDLVNAQVANAVGLSHFFLRDDNGQFVRVTDPKAIEIALNTGEKDKNYWVHIKDPSTQAFTALADRAIDKPVEPPQELDVHGDLVIRWGG